MVPLARPGDGSKGDRWLVGTMVLWKCSPAAPLQRRAEPYSSLELPPPQHRGSSGFTQPHRCLDCSPVPGFPWTPDGRPAVQSSTALETPVSRMIPILKVCPHPEFCPAHLPLSDAMAFSAVDLLVHFQTEDSIRLSSESHARGLHLASISMRFAWALGGCSVVNLV